MATAEYHRRWKAKRKAEHPELWRAQRDRQNKRDREKWKMLSPEEKARRSKVGKLWRKRNRTYQKEYHANYHKNHRREAKNTSLMWHYGLSIDCYELMLIEQNHRCYICDSDKPGGKGAFHVDHDSETGVVYKLLCHRCNTALGLLRHDENITEKVLLYIRRYRNDNARIITVGKAA